MTRRVDPQVFSKKAADDEPQGLRLTAPQKRAPNTRLLRVAIGSSILLIAGWLLLPGLLFPISSNAVVNAHVTTLRAPIEGNVLAITAVAGQAVTQNEVLVRLGNTRADDSQLAALHAQRATLQEKITILEQELAELGGLAKRLTADSSGYRDAMAARYEALLAEASARQAARQAVAEEASATLRRQQTLYAKRLTTLAALQAAQGAESRAHAELQEAERAVDRIKVEKKSAAEGIYFGDGYNNVPYTQQRNDEIQLRVQALRGELRDTRVRLKETKRQAKLEGQRLQRLASAELTAPAAGRIWLQLAATGEYVAAGAPLLQVLDTSRLFLMVNLDERHFDDIAVGDTAVVDLVGSQTSMQGVVDRVQGNETTLQESVLAVAPPPVRPREFLVVVNLDITSLAGGAEVFNQVGRRAKVSFHKASAPRRPSPA